MEIWCAGHSISLSFLPLRERMNSINSIFITSLSLSIAITVYLAVDRQIYHRYTTPTEGPYLLTGPEEFSLSNGNPLPRVSISKRIWYVYPNDMWRGLRMPVIIAQPLGRLGNVMGEYASLLAIGTVYGVTVRLHPAMDRQLKPLFPNITMERMPGEYHPADWTRVLAVNPINYGLAEAAASGIMGPKLFCLTGYPFEIQLFNAFRKDIMREFTFSRDIQNQVEEFWDIHLKGVSDTMIGVHVRRTDYMSALKHFKSVVPGQNYYYRAMDYYREKFPDVHFLVASDDMQHVKRAFAGFTDVSFGPGSPRELDMALLASCNHSVITLGSFGFWSGYLSGGEVVYPDIPTTEFYPFQRSWYEFGQLSFFTPLPPY